MKTKKVQVGQTFVTKSGCTVRVIEYHNSRKVLIQFNGNEDQTAFTHASQLRKGEVKNPFKPSILGRGYLGDSEIVCSKNGVKTRPYLVWRAMLHRCYSPRMLAINRTYRDCEVDPQWYNFKVFSDWLTSQPFYDREDYDLDKDLLGQGRKLYSSETCALIPSKINNAIVTAKTNNSSLPLGVFFNRKTGMFSACLSIDSKSKYLGLFNTAQEAHSAYVVAKEAYVKRIALQHIDCVDKRVFDALMRWRVHPVSPVVTEAINDQAVNDLSALQLEAI